MDIDGITAHLMADDLESLTAASPSDAVRFLPGHDQWVMGPGSKDTHVTPPTLREAVTLKASVVTVGGVVRGSWTTRAGELAVTWLDGTRPSRSAIEEETSRLVSILGLA